MGEQNSRFTREQLEGFAAIAYECYFPLAVGNLPWIRAQRGRRREFMEIAVAVVHAVLRQQRDDVAASELTANSQTQAAQAMFRAWYRQYGPCDCGHGYHSHETGHDAGGGGGRCTECIHCMQFEAAAAWDLKSPEFRKAWICAAEAALAHRPPDPSAAQGDPSANAWEKPMVRHESGVRVEEDSEVGNIQSTPHYFGDRFAMALKRDETLQSLSDDFRRRYPGVAAAIEGKGMVP